LKKIFFSILITLLSVSGWGQNPSEFFDWLNQHKQDFIQCAPKLEGDHYRLCDNTIVKKELIKSLFKKTPEELHKFITGQRIRIKVYCQSKTKGNFAKYCVKPDSNKLDKLHGKFIPEENTILLQSDATRGDLIHEFIHYLQYQNSHLVYGRRYKAERVDLQKTLIKKMDDAIEKSKSAKSQQEILPLVQSVKEASAQLVHFSYWQDLIDEKNIFLLYLNYGHELGVEQGDLALARKNMGFICAREKLPSSQCEIAKLSSGKYFQGIMDLLKEIRPQLEDKQLKDFIENAPSLDPSLYLEKKISILNDYIFKKYEMVPDTNFRAINHLDNILPDSTLKNKKAHCLGLSILYLLLAEKTNMEAYLVRAPSHVFVRFCENSKCHNIETLRKGEIVEDSYFTENLFITNNSIKNGIYLKNLDSVKDMLASIYLGLGYISGSNRQLELAEFFYKKAIDNSRGFADAYSNLSAIYGAQGKMSQARVYSEIALKINPDLTPAMVNLGVYYQNSKDLDKAKNYYDEAIKLNPIAIEAYRRRAKIHQDLDKNKEALSDLEHILIVNPNFCDVLEDSIQFSQDQRKIEVKKAQLKKLNDSKSCLSLPIDN
jgi:tetratricopeptide (TPR) repeat protein